MKKILAALAVLGLLAALSTWPVLSDVETGRTPEYPDLVPRRYHESVEQVAKRVRDAIATLPRWERLGEGRGPAGAEIQAVHTTRFLRFEDDVIVHIRREQGATVVSVRSRSRIGKWDFGQNARNVRELLAALDRGGGPG